MAERLGSAVLELKADQSKLHRGLDQSKAKTEKTTTGMGAAFKKLRTPIGIATGAIVGLGVAVTKLGADFEAALSESLAIMGDVSETLRGDMSDAARDVAKATTFSAREAGESYFFLASAGLDAAQSVAALPQVAQFAQAGMFDMARATDLLTDAQSALGLASNDAQQNLANMARISDVLVKANTLANASVSQFSEALTNRAGASLRILNKDVEEGVAVLAAFADQGIKGSMAGEQLSIVIRDLQNASLKNADAFRQAGISVFDSSGQMRNFGDIIGDLEGRLAGMSDEQVRAELTTLGFQDRSVQALLTLVGTSDAIKDYEANLREAGGTTKEVADKQLNNFNAQLKLLQSVITDIAIEMSDKFLPALRDLVEGASGFLDVFGTAREVNEIISDWTDGIQGSSAATREQAAELLAMAREMTSTRKLMGDLITNNFALRQAWQDSGLGITEFNRLLYRNATRLEDHARLQEEVEAKIARTREGLLLAAPATLEFAGAIDYSNDSALDLATGIARLLTYAGRRRVALQTLGKELPEIAEVHDDLTEEVNLTTGAFSVLGTTAADAQRALDSEADAARNAAAAHEEYLAAQDRRVNQAAFRRQISDEDLEISEYVEPETTAPVRTGRGTTATDLDRERERTAELERQAELGDLFGEKWVSASNAVQTAELAVTEARSDSFELAQAVETALQGQEDAADAVKAKQEEINALRSDESTFVQAINRELERQKETEGRLKAAQDALTEARRSDFHLATAVTRARERLASVERSIRAETQPFTEQERLLQGQLRQMDIADAQQKIASTTGREQIEAQLRFAQLNIADIRAKREGDRESAQRQIQAAQAAHQEEIQRRARVVADRQAEVAAARQRVTDAKTLLATELKGQQKELETLVTAKEAADVALVDAKDVLKVEQERRDAALETAKEELSGLDLLIQLAEFYGKTREDGEKKTLGYLKEQARLLQEMARLAQGDLSRINFGEVFTEAQGQRASYGEFAQNLGVSGDLTGLLDRLFPVAPAAMASGGLATSPTLAMIGEAGPEAVIPLSRMGGMGVTVINRGTIVHDQEFVDLVVKAQNTARRQGRMN